MTTDNRGALAAAAHRRSQQTRERAVEALRQLDAGGANVTVMSVANAAAVSRSWLYRQADLRDEIDRLRTPTGSTITVPSAQRASTDSLRQRLEASHDEIRRLKSENLELREQVARHHGQQRADRLT